MDDSMLSYATKLFWKNVSAGNVQATLEALSQGVSSDVLNDAGLSAIMVSIKHDNVEMLSALLNAGASPDLLSQGDKTRTALHIAAHRGNLEAVKVLVERGASVNVRGDFVGHSLTPLGRAAERGTVEVLEYLLTHDAEAFAVDGEISPLGLAALSGNFAAAEILLAHGADINHSDEYGSTALMEVSTTGCTPLAKYLVEIGKADISKRNNVGDSALDEAIRHEMWETAHYLWTMGGDAYVTRSSEGVGHATWIRPYIQTPPLARYHSGFAAIGTTLYLCGGMGSLKAGVSGNYNPDAPSESRDEPVLDFFKLDLQQVVYSHLTSRFNRAQLQENSIDPDILGKNLIIDQETHLIVEVVPVEVFVVDRASNARSRFPIQKSHGLAYFEVSILELAAEGCVGVGYVDENVTLDSLPGWRDWSVGLHSDDGCAFNCSPVGLPWGTRFYAGDVVGAGIDFQSNEIFFTLNGEFLGVAYRGLGDVTNFYPSIGFRTPSGKAVFNFGASPFCFDFRLPTLKWVSLGPVPQNSSYSHFHQLVAVDNQLVLFEGGSPSDEVQVFDTTTEKWRSVPSLPYIGHWNSRKIGVHAIGSTIYVSDRVGRPTETKPTICSHSFTTNSCHRTVQVPFSFSFGHEPLNAPSSPEISDDDDSVDSDASEDDLPDNLEHNTFSTGLESEEGLDALALLQAKFPELSLDASSNPTQTLESQAKRTKFIISDIFKECPTLIWNKKLSFISKTEFATYNPVTRAMKLSTCHGRGPVSNSFSAVEYQGHVAVFGGWDDFTQRADLSFLNPTTMEWYQNAVSGIIPRPRSLHSSLVVRIPKTHPLVENLVNHETTSSHSLQMDTNSTRYHLEGDMMVVGAMEKENTLECLILFGGWSGHSHLNDLEILVPSSNSSINRDMSWEPRPMAKYVVILEVTDPRTHEMTPLTVEASLLAARASRFNALLHDTLVGGSEAPKIPISAHLHLMKSFLQFLWNDQVFFPYHHDEARAFYDLVIKWGPEHGNRVSEALLMTKLYQKTIWASQLSSIFNSPLYSDVTLQFDRHSIRAHKCVLMANPYFCQLFGSGLAESSLDSIPMECSYSLGFHLIRYIYTKEIILDDIGDDIGELFQLSDKFQILGLKQQLEAILCYNLSVSNVVSIANLSISHNAPQTARACAVFIAANPAVQEDPEYISVKESMEQYIQQRSKEKNADSSLCMLQ